MKNLKQALCAMLAAVMLLTCAAVPAFAALDFEYHYSDEQHTGVVIDRFTGTVPEDGMVEIPATIEALPVVRIADGAFADNATLKAVILPVSTVVVDAGAFTGCANEIRLLVAAPSNTGDKYATDVSDFNMNGTRLISYTGLEASVALPYGCTSIAPGAFKGNTAIQTLRLTTDVTSIGESAFENCVNLKEIIIDTGRLTYTPEVGVNAFKNTPVQNNSPDFFMIGSTLVKYTGSDAGVTVPAKAVRISSEAFVNEVAAGIAAKIKIPPTAKMFDSGCFLAYNGSIKLIAALTVYAGSEAQAYCNRLTMPYSLLYLPCDADVDGTVTAADARYALRVSAKLEKVPTAYPFTKICDMDGDSRITASDARFILRVSASLESAPSDEITSDSDIVTEPSGTYDALLLLAQVIGNTRNQAQSFMLYEYQEFTEANMNMTTRGYLSWFDDQLTHKDAAETKTYVMNSVDGLTKLREMKLRDTTIVKDCRLTTNPDGTGNIHIELFDERLDMRDTYKNPLTMEMFPVEPVATYTDRIRKRWWFNDSGTSLHFTMTYTGCTLDAAFDPANRRLISMKMDMKYYFDIDPGTIQNFPILDASYGNDGANATRHDSLSYSGFRY